MQRWSLFAGDGRYSTGMAGDPDGAFVEFADYDTLRAQLESAEARAEAAEAECARMREDAERLDFLDRMNASLNAHYGTNYGWRLVLSHQITRLMSGEHRGGFVGDIDLNDQDGSQDGASSCRDAIDAARTKEQQA